MKKIARRDKMKIYGDLLTILQYEINNEKIVLTRLQLKLNVPFDRLKQYLTELKDLDLIEDVTSPKLTEKGKEYISEYEKVLDFMRRMGLEYQK
ncbi:MAG: winged helix-turn-helix domain-containing protein [Candidatus Bathyarchaeota archaeon]|nr:winged helix-turn-helix domain-containing protein [Candidatus Bathyarchaeota archaeon]